MRIAIVYDWLTNMGGGEKLLLSIHKAFPDAPIYTSVYLPEACPEFKDANVHTTWLQHFPKFLRRHHQLFPVLRAYAFKHLKLTGYDVVLSVTSAEAKAVQVGPNTKHICYCFTPTRYYWSHYDEYKRNPGFGWLNPLIRLIIPPFVAWMRKLDLQAADGVDYFIANSTEVAARIKKYYQKDSQVIYPPVLMDRFKSLNISGPRQGFVQVGRQVPYKRFDLSIAACNRLKIPLTLYGNGPEHDKLVAMAGPTIKFVVGAKDTQVAQALTKAQAFLYPQQEDFGITQVEAMAAGCPVIAYAKGGALDVVIEGKTGVFFNQQTVDSLTGAIGRFNKIRFAPKIIQTHANEFGEERFIQEIKEFTEKQV